MEEPQDAHQSVDKTLLSIRNATKRFPGVLALDDVSLDLNYGEVLALVGENGAGKSTLMKLLSGIYQPDGGDFWLQGKPFVPLSPRHAQELGISIIHQEFNLMSDLTVAENIYLGRELQTWGVMSKRKQTSMAQELLDKLHLPVRANALVDTLSVAEQQMVEIAKALSYDAKVLIMDEPTAALNEVEVRTLFDIIRRFVSPKTGVIYISHRLQEIPQIADRISVLRDGTNAGTLNAKTCKEKDIISLMVGREINTEVQRPPQVFDDVVLKVENLGTPDFLKGISFEVRAGEILGFAGLMGAGRTEMARALIGADKTNSGVVQLHGQRIDTSSPAKAARAGIGYLSEDRKKLGILVEQNVAENIALPSLPSFVRGGMVNGKAIATSAQQYVEALKIKTPSITQTVGNLSGGNQQKVAIAKWLLKDCEVLIFDEPTRGIDVGAKEEIYTLLEQLATQGKALIVISSDLPEVLRVSDRIAVMSDGELATILPAQGATQEMIMEYATPRSESQVAS